VRTAIILSYEVLEEYRARLKKPDEIRE